MPATSEQQVLVRLERDMPSREAHHIVTYRPKMRTSTFGAAAQIMDPTSNKVMAARNVHFRSKMVKICETRPQSVTWLIERKVCDIPAAYLAV